MLDCGVEVDHKTPQRPRTREGVLPGESRLAYKEERGALPRDFFLMRGKSRATHRARAASSRSPARPVGVRQIQPSERSNLGMCLWWSVTLNVSRMSRATRRPLQWSLEYPCAVAPRRSFWASRRLCSGFNRGGRPLCRTRAKADFPPRRQRCSHCDTACRETPVRPAISEARYPRSKSSTAFSRRTSYASRFRWLPMPTT